MKHLIVWLQQMALSAGGLGLFVVGFIDSSLLSLPEGNDLLIMWLVMRHKDRLLYYAAMSTLGSIAGCFVIYWIGRKGGEALLRRRFDHSRVERGMATFQRYGLLAVLVPSILPPPAPFKIFVLLAGAARVRVGTFTLAIAVGRGFRYLAEGLLAIWYGEAAIAYVSDHAKPVGLAMAGVILLCAVAYVLWKRLARTA